MTTRRTDLVATVGVGLLVGLADDDEAHACSYRPASPTSIHGPRFREPEVEITRTALALRCDDEELASPLGRQVLRCQVQAIYRLDNLGAAPLIAHGEVEARSFKVYFSDVTVLSRPELHGEDDGSTQVWTFDLPLKYGEHLDLSMHTEVLVELAGDPCRPVSILRRHARWATPKGGLLLLDGRSGERDPIEVHVNVPRRYDVAQARDDDDMVLHVTADRREFHGWVAPGPARSLDLERDRRFVRGGPFVAAGIDLGGGHPRPRLRVGYELAAPFRWWIHALAVESDLKALTVAPTTEAAFPLVFPMSAGVGLGVPLRVMPEVRAGVRAQVTLVGIGRVAAVGTVDLYPVRGGRDELRGGVMLQLGL